MPFITQSDLDCLVLASSAWVDDVDDAKRYRFLRDHFAQSHSLQMSGTSSYRLRGGWPNLVGRSFDEAVDNAIKEVEFHGINNN